MKSTDFLVIGGGAAGLSAGMYAGRYLISAAVIRGPEPGGETATAWTIENYPGFLSIDGLELVQKMEAHAKAAGAELVDGTVTAIEKKGNCFIATVGDEQYSAKTIVLAVGSARRRLGLPNEENLRGKGISYCATCDAPLYKGRTVAIVGGGDSSIKGVNLVARYATKVYLIVRGTVLKGEPANLKQLSEKTNVEVLYENSVKEIIGTTTIEKVILDKEVNGSKELPVGGLFVEIGAQPRTELSKMLGVDIDEKGHIKVNKFMHTNVPGVFAAGDITDGAGDFRQDITAAAQGAMAATSAYKYIGAHPEIVC
ncbi:MAG: FAD-dependent oxidoreductase [Patescibacteria group bacterium]